MGRQAKFCFVCGAKTRMAYPGGDPENGPAHMRCSADPSHESLREACEDAQNDFDVVRAHLEDLAGQGMFGKHRDNVGEGPQYVEIPEHVRSAAAVLLADDDEQTRIGNEWHARQENAAKMAAAENPRAEADMLARLQEPE